MDRCCLSLLVQSSIMVCFPKIESFSIRGCLYSRWHAANNRETVCTFEKGLQTHNSKDTRSEAFNQSFFLGSMHKKVIQHASNDHCQRSLIIMALHDIQSPLTFIV